MLGLLTRRILVAAATILLASFGLFLAVGLLPGDEVRAMFGFGGVPQEEYERLLRKMHYDRHVVVQYGFFLRDVVTLDFGTTMRGAPIRAIVLRSLPVSARLMAGVFAVQVVLAPVIVWVSGRHAGRRPDRLTHATSIALVSIPALVAGFLLQAVFAYWTDIFPSPTWMSGLDPGAEWRNYVLPILALGLGSAAHLALVGRTEMLEALAQPWARAARGFGIPQSRLVSRHASRPAAGAMVQLVGANLAALITGLVVIEELFLVPGMGRALIEAIHDQDRLLIVTLVTVFLAFVIVVSTIADVVHGWLDPRLRDADDGS